MGAVFGGGTVTLEDRVLLGRLYAGFLCDLRRADDGRIL
jgi:hypothetical protein